MQNVRIFISSTLKVYWIIELFVLQITVLYIISPNIIQVSKDTLTILKTSNKSVDFGF